MQAKAPGYCPSHAVIAAKKMAQTRGARVAKNDSVDVRGNR
jgi:hypothetical protein